MAPKPVRENRISERGITLISVLERGFQMPPTQRDVMAQICSLGWSVRRVDGGQEGTWTMTDRRVRVLPKLRTPPHGQSLRLLPSVGTEGFDHACNTISQDPPRSYWAWAPDWKTNLEIRAVTISPQAVVVVLERILQWAADESPEDHLANLCRWPTASIGDLPLKHLAALALAGDVDRVRGYLESFGRGDRLGFALYITVDHIERALAAIDAAGD